MVAIAVVMIMVLADRGFRVVAVVFGEGDRRDVLLLLH